ncbi:MAG TPA: thymidine phosphorylase [Candidatus Krumholzibacteriaceae bacterium]
MNAYELIRRKREALPLGEDEIRFLVAGYLRDEVSDYQMAAFLMATAIRGMTAPETVALTRVMMESGRVFDFRSPGGPVIDKHSTGGVGDKISLPLVPIAAECGLRVPMISGRSLGATGGTLDKLESIPGMRTDLEPARFERQVAELGACFGAQTADIVPADRRLYALRDATATVESIPLIVSSILSKKFAEGIRGVVIDVKCGSGAFMRTPREARELASALEATGAAMEIPVKTIITSMEEPLGLAVGNALEVEEAIRILEGHGPADAVALTRRLVAEMLLLGGLVEDLRRGEALARGAIESGRALERFARIVSAQGGRLEMTQAAYGLPRAGTVRPLAASSSGFVSRIDARIVGETVRELGGGRFRTDDAIDPRVGIVLGKKCGSEVAAGEVLLEIHAPGDEAADSAARTLAGAIDISREPVTRAPLVLADD